MWVFSAIDASVSAGGLADPEPEKVSVSGRVVWAVGRRSGGGWELVNVRFQSFFRIRRTERVEVKVYPETGETWSGGASGMCGTMVIGLYAVARVERGLERSVAVSEYLI